MRGITTFAGATRNSSKNNTRITRTLPGAKGDHMRARGGSSLACVAFGLWVWAASAAAPSANASVSVSVEERCGARQLAANDFTANAIVTTEAPDGCTVRWTSPTNPVSGRATVALHYGQPGQVVQLTSEPIQFVPDAQAGFVATRHFPKDVLGSKSFVTVLVTSSEEILQWTAWTVRATPLPPEPPPAANQSLDIIVGAVHVDTSRGPFPPSRQAEGAVWAPVRPEIASYELDGDDTGSPGIHVSIANAWTPTDLAASSVKEAMTRRGEDLAGITTHQVKLNGLGGIRTASLLQRHHDLDGRECPPARGTQPQALCP
jgi:hypothetical protein